MIDRSWIGELIGAANENNLEETNYTLYRSRGVPTFAPPKTPQSERRKQSGASATMSDEESSGGRISTSSSTFIASFTRVIHDSWI